MLTLPISRSVGLRRARRDDAGVAMLFFFSRAVSVEQSHDKPPEIATVIGESVDVALTRSRADDDAGKAQSREMSRESGHSHADRRAHVADRQVLFAEQQKDVKTGNIRDLLEPLGHLTVIDPTRQRSSRLTHQKTFLLVIFAYFHYIVNLG